MTARRKKYTPIGRSSVELNSTLSQTLPFAGYRPAHDRYDECLDGEGAPRESWRPIAAYLDRLGADHLKTCAAEAERLVQESGANFKVTQDEQARPWQLAIVPFVIDSDSWSKLAVGLQQRVRLLEAVVADLLGERRLVKERVLPGELFAANPEFHRVYPVLPATGVRLHLTATDLARDDDGSWWVTGDRTRAPSGLGYALENRVITSRVLPQLIHRSNVTRLASFFGALQDHLNSLAPRMRDNPRVAILTPGQDSYRYVEDAYLARYLGYTLVQGRDLAVRGSRLNLKTLGGLLPIEVLLRHVSDHKCDPLELDPMSTQGTTGMLQAIRAGTVSVANSIGSALGQMPALMPFLPAASRFLFGEELLLPSVPTYWCGAPTTRQNVLEHLDEWLIRPAFVVSGKPPVVASELTAEGRAELIGRIKSNPHQFIAQRRPARSTTPVWHDGKMNSWHVALRTFQLQSETDIQVMPGGLARVSPDPVSLDRSPASGRLGQDCWVTSDEQVDLETTLLPSPHAEVRLTRSGAELPSRVAENLFWFGRYAERTEAIARVLRTTMVRIAGESTIDDMPDLPRLVAALAAMGHIEPDYAIKEFGDAMPTLETVLPDSVFDRQQPRGLQAGVVNMLDKATAVRDRISLDAYRIITRIGESLTDPGPVARSDVGAMIERVNKLITELLALSGLANEGMTRTHGWRFLQLGRRIERASQTAELLAATLVHPISDERPLLESVLRATDSLMTYRARYLLQLQPVAVIDLLVTDDMNPRSIGFQLQSINEMIDQLPTDASDFGRGQDQKIAESLLHQIRMSDPGDLAAQRPIERVAFNLLMQELINELPKLSNAISARYLIHTGATQELTGLAGPIEMTRPDVSPPVLPPTDVQDRPDGNR